ncbi:YppG family protein [Bacillus timonensis]|uniref:YppG family protein n=1 Tax=Bacillus timonensis TaxID=1033734 RepID=UPI00028991AE
MVYGRPRRSFPSRPYNVGRQQRPYANSQPSNISSLMSHFQTTDGKLDFNKISTTAGQMKKIYSQVTPLLSMFLKK